MRRHWLVTGLVLAIAALLLGGAACGGGEKESAVATETPMAMHTAAATPGGGIQSTVAVTLVEYQVVPQPASVPAGSITFNVRNIGGTEHEMHVVQADLAPDQLPTNADGSVDEAGAGITMLEHVTGIQPQEEKSLTVDLAPGSYVLVCNIVQTVNEQTVSHYARGMHAAFTVTQ